MRRTMFALGLGLVATFLATGCQLGGGGGDEAKATTPASTRKAAAAAPTPQSSGAPVVSKSVTMPISGHQGQTFTLGFAGLRVKGPLATLTLVWTPHGIADATDSIFDMCGSSGGDVSMIDTTNLKRYVVVHDSGDHELGPNVIGAHTANDQPLSATYTFAAPQANASTDIYLDNRKVLESVPVTR